MSNLTSKLTARGQRAKVDVPRINTAYVVSGEIPKQHLEDAVSIYCRWMIRLYLERQAQQDSEPRLGAA